MQKNCDTVRYYVIRICSPPPSKHKPVVQNQRQKKEQNPVRMLSGCIFYAIRCRYLLTAAQWSPPRSATHRDMIMICGEAMPWAIDSPPEPSGLVPTVRGHREATAR